MFVDASALCAILLGEAEAEELKLKLAGASHRLTSAIAVFETVRALLRETELDMASCRSAVLGLLDAARIEMMAIDEAEQQAALDALDRFGKGRHPARLNMGDCFAYACARTRGVPLLFKGDDFSRTDIVRA